MYTHLKFGFIIYILVLPMGCISSPDDNSAHLKNWETQCQQAKHGKLDIHSGNYTNPLVNSYLFECAVSVVIPNVSMVSGESKSKRERLTEKMEKVKIADLLLSKGIDPKYTNENGDTLLMLVVSSFLPDEWKENTVRVLIKKGVCISETNLNGDTVMGLAEYRGTPGLIKILSEKK